MSLPIFSALLLVLASSCAAQGPAPPQFRCGPATPRCQALVGYVIDNETTTTYDAIKTLFQVQSIPALYGANDVDAATPASTRVPAGTTVRVPFPCACSNGTGIADGLPVYTVKSGDILFNISTIIFKGFVTVQQIADVNRLPDPNLINSGQELRIPLPCSCDLVDDVNTVHLAHVVARGSSIAAIAAEFGTTEGTLQRINGIADPKTLMAGQVLDVPLRACGTSIRRESFDNALRVTNGSYALTASDCVKCSCSSSSWQLSCQIVNSTRSRSPCAADTCPAGNSSRIQLGQEVPLGPCSSTRCDYAGFNSSSILVVPVNNTSTCGTPPSEAPAAGTPGSADGTPGSAAYALLPPPWGPSGWVALLNAALILVAFV